MYINWIPFLVTIAKHLKFIYVVPINKRSKDVLCEACDNAFHVYNKGGFVIAKLHVDMEFKVLEDYMIDDDNSIDMVYVPAQQHVPEVERAIGVIKE